MGPGDKKIFKVRFFDPDRPAWDKHWDTIEARGAEDAAEYYCEQEDDGSFHMRSHQEIEVKAPGRGGKVEVVTVYVSGPSYNT